MADLETSHATLDHSGLPGVGGASTAVAHGCRAKNSGNISVGNNTYTVLTFDGEDFDTDTIHSTGSNTSRLTIPSISGVTTGLWTIKASGYVDATTGRVDVMIRKGANASASGGTLVGADLRPVHSSGASSYFYAVDAEFAATDYVECFVRTSGGAGNVAGDANLSPIFTIAFLGKVT